MKRTNSRTKAQRIDAEKSRLLALFDALPQNKKEFAVKLIEQLAWYNVSIAELHQAIDKDGSTVFYDNGGGQSGVRKNPDVDTLVSYQKLVNAICGNLLKLFEDLPSDFYRDKLQEFIDDANDPQEDWQERQARIDAELRAAAEKQRLERLERDRNADAL